MEKLEVYIDKFGHSEQIRARWEDCGVLYDTSGKTSSDGKLEVRYENEGDEVEEYCYFEYIDEILDTIKQFEEAMYLEAARSDSAHKGDRGEFYRSDVEFCINIDGVTKRYIPTASDNSLFEIYNIIDGEEIYSGTDILLARVYYKAIKDDSN